MSFEELVENRIQEAMNAGVFAHLPGAGRPMRFDDADRLAGENWIGFRIMRDSGALPPWLMLAREIEQDELALAGLEARHAEWLQLAAASGDWRRHAPALRNLGARIAVAARALRAKQDRFNVEAPSIALERPGIWVDRRLGRLRDQLARAGAPCDVIAPLD
ncbi:MAG: DUF1992 domain-containing protein [Dehalococcoidia bacterium]|nr:DUF1992 domain-containing protein [Dehalococcoidia bacterium]